MKSLLFYCQHSLGMGHLTRSFTLAGALTKAFRVHFINGGPFPAGIQIPSGIEITSLPPLGMDKETQLISQEAHFSVDEAREKRRRMILDLFHETQPEVLFIEFFPLGRKKFAFELIPLLESARIREGGRPRVYCSIRDILVHRPGAKQQAHDDRAARRLEEYFDALLVHSDPAFASLGESFKPNQPVPVPVHYTGFVAPPRQEAGKPGDDAPVLVSAGGGRVGYPLFRAALNAHKALWQRYRLPMKMVTGPFLPELEWESLRIASQGCEGLTLLRSVPNLLEHLQKARASVSQCGYNTVQDILRAGRPALVVPFQEGQENEQIDRAHRLSSLGAVRILEQKDLDAASLGDEILALLKFQPAPLSLNLDGAKRTLEIVQDGPDESAAQNSGAARVFEVKKKSTDWLQPVREALENRQVRIFFRNDDAGWSSEKLLRLVDLFIHRETPIDLAVIPAELHEGLAQNLLARKAAEPRKVGLHQHGFLHCNHETEGRKCEFGPSRPLSLQLNDIEEGKARLAALLGDAVDPIFTPPWNRCTQDTVTALQSLGFMTLSRDRAAKPVEAGGLVEIPVHVDWFKKIQGVRITQEALGHALADAIRNHACVGVMLHHEVFEEDDWGHLSDFLQFLTCHPNATCGTMMDLLGAFFQSNTIDHKSDIHTHAVSNSPLSAHQLSAPGFQSR